ncbi:ANR family transcriptional regulator [Serratia sp. 1D1416]|uniref:ANR family transcriptional regulator n=1 Tax=Serratia sp. 1D1416 TaxID=2447890 RepID=UPI001013C5A6|nr:ANR family transcriptional regulator [Serratia sp. 1D1416]
MMKIPYSEAAKRAIQHEKAEEFSQASTFWRIAESLAVKPVNQQWAATRSDLCEKRHSLEERLEQLSVETSQRLKMAAETKAAKKELAAKLEAHMNTTSEEV